MTQKLSQQESSLVRSRLPILHTDPRFGTKRPSLSKYKLVIQQVDEWDDLVATVQKVVGNYETLPALPITPRLETHGTANETGLQGRYTQHISDALNPLFDSLELDVRMADFEYGTHRTPSMPMLGKKARKKKLIPDLVIVKEPDHHIRIVVELKTHWTFWQGCKNKYAFLAERLGQVARYMDHYQCRFGCLSTYRENWFIRRKDNFHFEVSESIPARQESSIADISLREAFLYLASQATEDEKSFFKQRLGEKLTDGKTFKSGAKRSLSSPSKEREDLQGGW